MFTNNLNILVNLFGLIYLFIVLTLICFRKVCLDSKRRVSVLLFDITDLLKGNSNEEKT